MKTNLNNFYTVSLLGDQKGMECMVNKKDMQNEVERVGHHSIVNPETTQQNTSPFGEKGEAGGGCDRQLQVERARAMRKNPTEAEKKLWMVLRGKNLEGYKFRRQHPIGPYIVDFCCLKKKLVIEVDGGQHLDQQDKDLERTLFLKSRGFHVLRFWNDEVLNRTDDVCNTILQILNER